uniref:Tpd52 like 2a n=1 Tax=Poecilia formosa TaxID=48698 RepID=A0A096MDT3_POEFO
MSRQVFNGTSSSLNFSTRITGNGCSHTNLREDDWDTLRFELTKTEDEIQTLRQVLLAKEKYAADIRRQLGMSPLSNVKQNLSKGWQEVQTSAPYLTASATLEDISNSSVYVRTRDGLSQASQVTSAALSNVGVAITRRLAQMRHSSTFKSIEELVGSMKDKVTGGVSNSEEASGFERRSSRNQT